MAKITDLTIIENCVVASIAANCPDLVNYIGAREAVWCVMGIYLLNDKTKGYGQDFRPSENLDMPGAPERVSVISFRNGISVIIDDHSSRYQDNVDLCGYEDLDEDIHAIEMYIQTAIDRISANVNG